MRLATVQTNDRRYFQEETHDTAISLDDHRTTPMSNRDIQNITRNDVKLAPSGMTLELDQWGCATTLDIM